MEKKIFIKIINEEISNFDFLHNNEYLKEEETYDLLKNEDFQKQFICDSLISGNKIKQHVTDARLGGNWENGDDASKLTIEYFVEIDYTYDPNKEPAKFRLTFDSEQVEIGIHVERDRGSYEVEPSVEAHYTDINWRDIEVSLFTLKGDEIEFIAFERAPIKIQVLFIREYVEKFISNETADTQLLRKDNVRSVPYC